MAERAVTVVEQEDITGPHEGQYGEYFRHTLKTPQGAFHKNSKDGVNLTQSGQSVTIFFDTLNTKDGQINKIVKLSTSNVSTSILPKAPQNQEHLLAKTFAASTSSSSPTINSIQVSSGSTSGNNVKGSTTSSYETKEERAARGLSQEVSGLLQAIIQKHGVTDKLQVQMEEALQVKDLIVEQRKNKQ